MSKTQNLIGQNGPAFVNGTMTRAQINAATINLPPIFATGRYYPYSMAPEHPDKWDCYYSRDLQEHELHEAQLALWEFAQGRFSVITHYTPALKLLVYFEKTQDAVAWKLSWGGQ